MNTTEFSDKSRLVALLFCWMEPGPLERANTTCTKASKDTAE